MSDISLIERRSSDSEDESSEDDLDHEVRDNAVGRIYVLRCQWFCLMLAAMFVWVGIGTCG